ncbi:hypothetical protein [Indioceanicola profundi]|uniref:hypothetical protein n=1 Tax=Indioceanicola profundi TaxID=2220096 RepID=UPI0013C5342F|nr:hypothetical protein [Indioceanicola profundi]
MRQHGAIRENRNGLAAVLGLLGGIIAGALLLAPAEESKAGEPALHYPTARGER